MIQVENLLFEYSESQYRLRIPALSISAGEHCAVCGPSGCGKTTLLRLLAGIQSPAAGTIAVGDQSVTSLSDRQRRDFRIQQIGFVFQSFELLDYLSVRDNVLLPYLINDSLRLTGDVRNRGKRLAESLGLADCWNRRANRLSQGEQQRVAICRALIADPSLILADEPTGNLDPDSKREAINLLRSSARETGATLIVVSHDDSVLQDFDRVIRFPDLLAT